ncbi:uncharacterized protein LOC123866366 isoform X3 [Maniola jurtina]|uniref:uncharacterized protein LOC123866366 isoform X2 n=1 Tax=Maniola jurtina TaxID=191418 RepID=UPI001E689EB9|nr:uncharacterized protein LOC123866366 isoform X2 [Maniola jurtina]XP_045763847.1 uncharacterized protein LOC123866366 isoform X3 [Maniola jurtina]
MEDENAVSGTEIPESGTGEGIETKEDEIAKLEGERFEKAEGQHVEGEQVEEEQHIEREHIEREHIEGEHIEGEHIEGEHIEGEHIEGEHEEDEHVEGEHIEGEERQEEKVIEGEELEGEELEGEKVKGEEKEQKDEEQVEEEEFVEPPPPDPAAPFNFTDSSEAIKPKFELRPDQIAEVEQLWELYQNYTPAYTDIHGYITEKELVYMLKSLLLMTFTPEQLQELIAFCVRPPHPQGHINYEQFLKMVTLRQRDFPIEEELRSALKVLDPGNTGLIDREYFRETLSKLGHKMAPKLLDSLVKEVDLSNDGTIGVEDVIGTMCIDLNKEDLMMLRAAVYPDEQPTENNND